MDGGTNFPVGFRVRAQSLPELVAVAEAHRREVLAGEDVKVRIFLVPDKVPPEPVVELHPDPDDQADRRSDSA